MNAKTMKIFTSIADK